MKVRKQYVEIDCTIMYNMIAIDKYHKYAKYKLY